MEGGGESGERGARLSIDDLSFTTNAKDISKGI